ncbi:MAG: glycosyltransferase [Nostoc sp. CreGUA01]|nr:hypothetical protein [Nostoc sp. CreGUA01]
MIFNHEKFLRLRSIVSSQDSLNVAFFCARLKKGYGVDLVVATQAQYLAAWGHKVKIYTLVNDGFFTSSFSQIGNIEVITLSTFRLNSTVSKIVCDVAIAHTDPFFELVLKMNSYVTKIAWDYGEPPPELFPEQVEQRKAQKEFRRLHHHLYHKAIAISNFVKEDMGLTKADVVYCGSDHLIIEHPQYEKLRGKLANLASSRGYSPNCLDKPFLLCVSRLGEIYSRYKGTNDLQELSRLTNMPIVLVGKSDTYKDVKHFKEQGLICIENPSNEQLISAYLDCSACVSLSRWEGYNLPLVEAIAVGRMSFALDLGAHKETGAKVASNINELSQVILDDLQRADQYTPPKTLYSWKENSHKLNSIIYETRLKHLSTILGDNSKTFVLPIINKTTLPRIKKLQSKANNYSLYFSNLQKLDLSILILSKDKINLLKPCLESIKQTIQHINYEILIGDTGSELSDTELYYKSIKDPVFYLGKYNFSIGNNYLASQARGRYILLLNNDTEAILPSIPEVIRVFEANQNQIGAVGCKLLYPNLRIQHAGVFICRHEPYKYIPEHVNKNCKSADHKVVCSQIVPAVTGACLFTNRQLFLDVGGLDSVYQEECQDIDYCFKLRDKYGLYSYYYADSTWIHKEGRTRSAKENLQDRNIFITRWQNFIDNNSLYSS